MGAFFPEESSENRISRVAVAFSDVPVEENGNAGMWRSALTALTRARQPMHYGNWSSTTIKFNYLSTVELFYFWFLFYFMYVLELHNLLTWMSN